MQSFNQHLIDLVTTNQISREEALKNSPSPEKLNLHFSGLSQTNDNNCSGKKFGEGNTVEMPLQSSDGNELKIKGANDISMLLEMEKKAKKHS